MRIMITATATAATMTTTDTLAATMAIVLGALGVVVGVTRLVKVGIIAQTGSVRSLILTGQSGSNVTTAKPVDIVAPCLTQSSI